MQFLLATYVDKIVDSCNFTKQQFLQFNYVFLLSSLVSKMFAVLF